MKRSPSISGISSPDEVILDNLPASHSLNQRGPDKRGVLSKFIEYNRRLSVPTLPFGFLLVS